MVTSAGVVVCLTAILSIFTGSLVPVIQDTFRGLATIYYVDSDTVSFGSFVKSDASTIQAKFVYAVERYANLLLQLGTFKYEYIVSQMSFYLYTRENWSYPDKLVPGKPLSITGSQYKPWKKTVVLFHGFTTDAFVADSVQAIKDELLKGEDINVIGVDYGPLTDIWWFHIFSPVGMAINTLQAPWIGQYTGELISELIDLGQSPDGVHLVGHSLGAHMAAFAGKYLKSVDRKAYRLTGLDPSSPVYSVVSSAFRLSKDDAKFTDCIFTTAKSLAVGNNPCQANYYPNGCGISQPGCYFEDLPAPGCSHSRVVDLFAESINLNSRGYQTQICDRMPCVGSGASCWPTNQTVMGYWANPMERGIFYTQTNAEHPFLIAAT